MIYQQLYDTDASKINTQLHARVLMFHPTEKMHRVWGQIVDVISSRQNRLKWEPIFDFMKWSEKNARLTIILAPLRVEKNT